MKKLILALVVVVLSVGSLSAQTKIGHINSQELLDTMPSRKAAIVKLQEFEVAGINELKEMEADFNQAYAKYERERPTMSPVIIKIEEEKLMKKQKSLQEREQSLQQEIQVYSQELNAPILDMVQKAVKVVADRMKLNYVLDESMLMYFDKGIDITDAVTAELIKMDTAQ